MGKRHKIWQAGVMKWAWVWGVNNIKMDLQRIERRSLDLAKERKVGGLFKMFRWICGCYKMWEIP